MRGVVAEQDAAKVHEVDVSKHDSVVSLVLDVEGVETENSHVCRFFWGGL